MTYQEKQKELIERIEKMVANNSFSATVVEIKKDFAASKEMCLSSVYFIPEEIDRIITEKIIQPLQKIDNAHYYYPEGTRHLTIKNIRHVNNPPNFTPNDIAKVDELYQKTIPKFSQFSFSLKGVMSLPTSLSIIGYSDEKLKDLVLTLDSGLKEIGVPDNKKYLSNEIFFGNITFCRFTHQPTDEFLQKVQELRNIEISLLPIKEVSLITCNAVCYPNTLKKISSYKLKI